MPTPSAKRALPQIAGTDSPDIPRDVNALITALEAEVGYLATRAILDTGAVSQTRAGRQLANTDFTALGYSTPVALYNLGDLTDASGAALALTNKGAIPFAPGIEGAAATAAQFAGSTAQALYRVDAGGADPFRLKVGSWGCWFRTGKRGTAQFLMSKDGVSPQRGWGLQVAASSGGRLIAFMSTTGTVIRTTLANATGIDVGDDRWHFGVATYDGEVLRVYVDGELESQLSVAGGGLMFGSSAPLNIGGSTADGSTAATSPHFGRVDEAFVLNDVLSQEAIRYLYAVKIAHAAPRTPRRAGLGVRRIGRGAALVIGDFPATPIRLYNFANALTDGGSGATAVVANPSTGAIGFAQGSEGLVNNSRLYSGTHGGDRSSDAGLPAGTTSRSYGGWFKFSPAMNTMGGVMGWGTVTTADARITLSSGFVQAMSAADAMAGPYVLDGLWHFIVVTEENTPADGVKRRLYVDGKLVANSVTLNSITLVGANAFTIGADPTGTGPTSPMQASRCFVTSSVLTPAQILTLYVKGSLNLGLSPKAVADHVEKIDATNVYFIGDTLEPNWQVDLEVAA